MVQYDKFVQGKDRKELLSYVNEMCESFLNSNALKEIFRILGVNKEDFAGKYNARQRSDGSIIEPQLIKDTNNLEKFRHELYPLLDELHFFSKNKPGFDDYSRIVVLGGTLNACNERTKCVKRFVTPNTKMIEGLSCYRPINPVEREQSKYHSGCDSEYGALSEAFVNFFDIGKSDYSDEFVTDRNINSVSCVRTFEECYLDSTLRVYACPSLEPEHRRADTGDCILHYVNNNTFTESDKVLFVSHNRYCMRQFLQVLYYLLKTPVIFPYDIIGYADDNNLVNEKTYNLKYDIQELVAIIDWVNRFKEEYI